MTLDPDADVRRLAGPALRAGNPTGWFESLYAAALEGAIVPWDRHGPNPLLVDWAIQQSLDGWGRRAMVVGCGYGDDANFLAERGFATTAFDISPSATTAAAQRFPHADIRWRNADLLDLPPAWLATYDLVFESMTVQSMPADLHAPATAAVSSLVAPGGTLLVVAAGRSSDEVPEGPPWPLTETEVRAFAQRHLAIGGIEDHRDPARPAHRRWRAWLHYPQG